MKKSDIKKLEDQIVNPEKEASPADLNAILNEVSDKTESDDKKQKQRKEEREKQIKSIVEKQFIRIGDKYSRIIHRPDKNGRPERLYVPWLKSTIIDDFGKNCLRYIKKYDGFCQVASHIDYKPEIHGHFNEYYQLTHKPSQGSWDTIQSILKHVFRDKFQFILDYMYLLYIKPTQRLPVLLLESKERNTGKSTFGSLLKLIFQENAIKVGNSDFESDFNSIWIKMLVIIVDETSLDKKGIMQQIKRLSTETSKVTVNEKNQARYQFEFIGKFIFMSNEEGRALPIEPGENRFAVIKVPTFEEAGIRENTHIEQDIYSEIPAFLHYLKHSHKLHFEEKSRMYFAPEVYKTEQLNLYYRTNQSYVVRAIRNYLSDAFDWFANQTELQYSATELMDQITLGKYVSKSPDRQQIKKALEDDLSLKLSEKKRYEYYNLAAAQNSFHEYYPESRNTRVYVFPRDKFQSDLTH